MVGFCDTWENDKMNLSRAGIEGQEAGGIEMALREDSPMM